MNVKHKIGRAIPLATSAPLATCTGIHVRRKSNGIHLIPTLSNSWNNIGKYMPRWITTNIRNSMTTTNSSLHQELQQ
jgi:hypothetical protein